MTFDLTTIAVLVVAAFVYALLIPPRGRGWFLMIGSVITVYWLQSALVLRHADFILPTLTLLLTVGTWYVTRKPYDRDQQQTMRQDWVAFWGLAALILGMASFYYLDESVRLTPSRPPNPLWVAMVLAVVHVVGLARSRSAYREHRRTLTQWIVVFVGLFIIIKTTPLITGVSGLGRMLTGQDAALANPVTDLSWLGFSYVAFRLIHTLRDRQTGILPVLSLRDYVTYVVFTPAFIAGPIDRAERFQQDMLALPTLPRFDPTRLTVATGRIAVGMFKKFVIADSLALGLALSPQTAPFIDTTWAAWLLLYGYALRLFFDFSGYTDIAIGIGVLFGVTLPENFNRPYFKTDITSFWQSWHITLSNWARFYVFSPLSRGLLRRKPKPSPVLIVFVSQLATMLTIGLWHGVTVNFFIWGLWHGLGLFVHKLYTDRTRKGYRGLKDYPGRLRAVEFAGWFVTFHFVVLSWVWFALPNFGDSLTMLLKLLGMG